MRNFILVLTLSVLFISGAFAQTPGSNQTQVVHIDPPKIPENIFPFGGFDCSSLNGIRLDPQAPSDGADVAFYGYNKYKWQAFAFQRVLTQAGFNAIYHVNSFGFDYNASTSPDVRDYEQRMAYVMPDGMVSYEGGTSFDINHFVSYEKNYFLLTSERTDPIFDYQTAPSQCLGHDGGNGNGAIRTTNLPFLNEWYSRGSTTDEELFAITDGTVATLLGGNECTGKAAVDFAFRLQGDETEIASPFGSVSSDVNILFTLQLTVTYPGNPNPLVTTQNIHWSDYVSHSTTYKPKETEYIKTFNGQRYAVVSLDLPLPSIVHDGAIIKLQLLTKARCGIFIRGFRVRTKILDEMLQGHRDNDIINGWLDCASNTQNYGMAKMASAYANTDPNHKITAITTAGEYGPEVYRSIAYLDTLWSKVSGGRRIYEFLSFGLYGMFRAIYQDENGVPPPTIMEENFSMTAYRDAPHPYVASDAIPYAFRHPPDGSRYDDMGFTIQGGGSSNSNAYSGYLEYLKDIQGDYRSAFTPDLNPQGKYNNAEGDYSIAGRAAYKHLGGNSKWYALINTITTLNRYNAAGVNVVAPSAADATPAVDATQQIHARNDFLAAIRKGPDYLRNYIERGGGTYTDFITRSKADAIPPTLSSTPQNFHDLVTRPGGYGNSLFRLDQRCINASEIRADVWHAIIYGAKGIYFNPIGSESDANIGFCDYEFGKYDPKKDTLGDNYSQADPSTGPFSLYDGPTYNANPALENHGLIRFGTGDPCTTGAEFLGVSPAAKVTWDARVIYHIGGATGLGNVYERQFIPMTFTDPGVTDPNQILADYLSQNNNVIPLIENGSYPNTDLLPDITKWAPLLRTDCGSNGNVQNWYVWNTSWDASVASDLLLPKDDNFKKFRFDNLISGALGDDYRFGNVLLAPRVPTFYGFHDKWVGVTTSIKDLYGIAPLLANLIWQNTVDLAASDNYHNNTDWLSFPIMEFIELGKDHTSQKVRRYEYSSSTGYTPRNSINEGSYTDQTYTSESPYDDPDLLAQSAHVDPSDERLFKVGKFKDPSDANAEYIVVANRRTWPVRFDSINGQRHSIKSTDGSDKLLGAIDVRQFNFELRWSELNSLAATNAQANPSYPSSYAYYEVTNMRTNVSTILQSGSELPVSVILEPGEGTLFRIRPAYSFVAGRTSDAGMAYNNGHRLADLLPDISNNARIMVWESQGNIQYNIVNSPALDGVNNYVDASTAVTIDNSGHAVNPSVAAKSSTVIGGPDTVTIIWNQTNSTVARPVFVRWGLASYNSTTGTVSIAWQSNGNNTQNVQIATVPWDVINGGNQLVTAAIAPAVDGFFACWAVPSTTAPTPAGIQPALVNFRGASAPLHVGLSSTTFSIVQAGSASHAVKMCGFGTVVTRDETKILGSQTDGSKTERLHLAWEEDYDDGSSQIYYKRYDNSISGSGVDVLDQSFTFERVSKGLLSCYHHHPNIALTNMYGCYPPSALVKSEPLVTWETRATQSCANVTTGDVCVVERERIGDALLPGYPWNSVTSFYPKSNNMPLPLVQSGGPYPLGCLDEFMGGPFSRDYAGLVFQDQTSGEVHVRRLVETEHGINWVATKLIEPGQYPNLSMTYQQVFGLDNVRSFTYRGTVLGGDQLYAARVTAMRAPVGEITETPQLVTCLTTPTPQGCENGLRYEAGRGSVGDPSAREPWDQNTADNSRTAIEWIYRDLHLDGSGLPYQQGPNGGGSSHTTSYGWPVTGDTLRTKYFPMTGGNTLEYTTDMLLDDTAWVRSFLTDTTRFVEFKLILKDSATRQTISVLQDVMLTRDGVTMKDQGVPQLLRWCGTSHGLGPTLRNTPLTVSGVGYLTLEASRDSLTPLDLFQELKYVENYQGVTNPDSSSFKMPGGGQPTPSGNLQLRTYPNPFNPSTTIEITASASAATKVEVMNVLGQVVEVLFDGDLPSSGVAKFQLDGSSLHSGTYFVRVRSGNSVVSKRVQLIR
jgi:hypothetical protein